MMLASGAPEGLVTSSLASRAHLDSSLALNIPCTTSPMFPGMLKLDKSVYSSPPPAPNIPENNICKLIEYRGHKVAAFNVQRRELICLPQAFELFLKNLVGGLHTVYTKLKRLGIMPVVCNVEQVRILRGLGAIQPGVNRCKLIAPKEFDILYDDCTNSSARPGRPPKRGSPSPLKDPHDLSPFRPKQSRLDTDIPGYSPYKWMDLMKSSPLFSNGYYYPPQMAAHLPFMPHPAMMALGGHLAPPSQRPSNGLHDNAPKDLSSPLKDLPCDRAKIEEMLAQREKNNNTAPPTPLSSSSVASPRHLADAPLNLNTRSQGLRRASIDDSGASSEQDDLSDTEVDLSSPSGSMSDAEVDERNTHNRNNSENDAGRLSQLMRPPPCSPHAPPPPQSTTPGGAPPLPPPPHPDGPEAGSMVALLLNMQGLLRMAIESAKHKEHKMHSERADLRREMTAERERRQHLEVQLADTQHTIMSLQRKLKKEKKLLRRLNDTMIQAQSLPRPAPVFPTPHPQAPPTSGHVTTGSTEHRSDVMTSQGVTSDMRPDVIRSSGNVDHQRENIPSDLSSSREHINGQMSPASEEARDQNDVQ